MGWLAEVLAPQEGRMMEGRDPRKRTNLGVAPGTGLAPVETVDVSMLFNDSLAAE